MTGDWTGLRKPLLILLAAHVVLWLCFVTLIALSVASADPLPRSLLLAWVLIAAGWAAVDIGRGSLRASWWPLVLMAPSRPVINAILGAIRCWRKLSG